jgi:hypothetical protein
LTEVREDPNVTLNVTASTRQKLDPLTVTVWPVLTVEGMTPVTAGAPHQVNDPPDVAVWPDAVTLMAPEAPPVLSGDTAVITVGVELDALNDLAARPPNVTAVTPTKFVPVIVTVVPPPAGPAVGVMPVIESTAGAT